MSFSTARNWAVFIRNNHTGADGLPRQGDTWAHITLSDTITSSRLVAYLCCGLRYSILKSLSFMAVFRVVRRLRNDPKFCLKYLFLVNLLLCLLCFTVNTENYNEILQREIDQKYQYQHRHQHDKEKSDHKFKDFQLDKWKEVDPFRLEDSPDSFFKWVEVRALSEPFQILLGQ